MDDLSVKLYIFFKMSMIILFLFQIQSCTEEKSKTLSQAIQFSDEGSHYRIGIDYTTGKSTREIGAKLGVLYKEKIPNFEVIGDAYLRSMFNVSSDSIEKIMDGLEVAKSRLSEDFLDELEGAAAQMSGTEDTFGDGVLSPNEYLLFNLEADMGYLTLCSGMGVNPEQSATGKALAIRALDWPISDIVKLQTVVVRKYDSVQTVTIGYAGHHAGLTTLNSHGVMVSTYMLINHYSNPEAATASFTESIKYAIESSKTAQELTTKVQGTFGTHTQIMVNDMDETLVVESDRLTSIGIRAADSQLQEEVEWGVDDCVPVVNSFLLEGKSSSIDNSENSERLASMRMMTEKAMDETSDANEKITGAELQAIFSYYSGNRPGLMASGDLYNGWTQQVIFYDFHADSLSAWFIGKDKKQDTHLSFENIPLPWQK